MQHKAIFLDKDDTVIPNIPYNVDPDRITLTDGVGETLSHLQAEGYLLVIITNQAGVARGYFAEEAIAGVEARVRALLTLYAVRIDGFFYCPHHPEGTVEPYVIQCDCRKPQPGLLLQAAGALNIDRSRSWMIGDSASDIEAGRKAGCTTILFAQYCDKETEIRASSPDFVADTFQEVEQIVLGRPGILASNRP